MRSSNDSKKLESNDKGARGMPSKKKKKKKKTLSEAQEDVISCEKATGCQCELILDIPNGQTSLRGTIRKESERGELKHLKVPIGGEK